MFHVSLSFSPCLPLLLRYCCYNYDIFNILWYIFHFFPSRVPHSKLACTETHTKDIQIILVYNVTLLFLIYAFLSASAHEISGATAECSSVRKMFFFYSHHAQLVGKNVCNILCMTWRLSPPSHTHIPRQVSSALMQQMKFIAVLNSALAALALSLRDHQRKVSVARWKSAPKSFLINLFLLCRSSQCELLPVNVSIDFEYF